MRMTRECELAARPAALVADGGMPLSRAVDGVEPVQRAAVPARLAAEYAELR